MNKKCELNVPRVPQMAVYIHQNSFGCRPNPLGELTVSPQTL